MANHKAQRSGTRSFVSIQVCIRGSGDRDDAIATEEAIGQISQPRPKLNLSSTMKHLHRFRKVLMRLTLSVLPSSSSSCRRSSDNSRHRNSDRFEPPKTSFSSYYSSYSHYNEAIADCIEFFNNSAQDGILGGRKSDVV